MTLSCARELCGAAATITLNAAICRRAYIRLSSPASGVYYQQRSEDKAMAATATACVGVIHAPFPNEG
jgi:hypothetical protein